MAKLNVKQLCAFNCIVESVYRQLRKLLLLNSPSGTAKTSVYNTVCHKVPGDGRIVLCVTSSGIAVLPLRGGWMAHSMFKIHIDIHKDSMCSISNETSLASLIQATALIIWDKVMVYHGSCWQDLPQSPWR